jgi:L-cysteate sulfo-lyase
LEHLQIALGRFPRAQLIEGPTKIERLTRLEAALGNQLGEVRLYAKRDDAAGLGGGGSKLRKLEYLIGNALEIGADTVIAIGGRQSNFARLTAAACARFGLACELFLTQSVPRNDDEYQHSGNILLDRLFGARIHDLPEPNSAVEHANARAEVLRTEGRKVLVASSGGSSPLGCLGYVACACEIFDQSRSLEITFDHIIVANGSSGTHAGLAAGFKAMGRPPSFIRSYSVLADEVSSQDATLEKARSILELMNDPRRIEPADIDVRGDQRGPGYGIPTVAMISAVQLMASSEGLLLDPVYSGKAFAGLLDAVRRGEFRSGANILFIMTGGTPGLFAYRTTFKS